MASSAKRNLEKKINLIRRVKIHSLQAPREVYCPIFEESKNSLDVIEDSGRVYGRVNRGCGREENQLTVDRQPLPGVAKSVENIVIMDDGCSFGSGNLEFLSVGENKQG